jgi:Ca-activated chloride channel family protein
MRSNARATSKALLLALALVCSQFATPAGAQTVTTSGAKPTAGRVTPPARRPTRRTGAVRTAPATAQPVRVPQLTPAQGAATPSPSTPAAQQTPAPAPSPAAAEAKPAEAIDDEEVYTVTSNLVVVPVAVTDAGGLPALGLKVGDFKLEEEGRSQEVAAVGDAEQVPLDIALVFDVSSSTTARRFFEFQQQSAVGFLKEVLKPADRAALFTIATEPHIVQELLPSAISVESVRALRPATVSTATAFYDTIQRAAKYLAEKAPGRHRRVIVVVSDGEDNNSNLLRDLPTADLRAEYEAVNSGKLAPAAARQRVNERHRRAVEAMMREVQRADAVFYSINPSGPGVHLNEISKRAQNGMQKVAESTGGTAYLPANAEELPTIFRQIANELRAQYLLQYYSNNDAPAGKFLSIKVRIPARPELKVRARQGYYSKKG